METYIAEGFMVILTSLMGYIVWLLKEQRKDKKAQEQGIMLLLRVQLIEYHDKYMRKGKIPTYAYQNFEEMYKAYRELGGNSMAVKMHEEINQLHLQQKGSEEDGL
jgi:hypothetical protein